MIIKRQMRKLHKYLGLFVGAQILIWTLSGLYFTLIPIEEIRGNHLLNPEAPLTLGLHELISPSALVQRHQTLKDLSIGKIRLAERLGKPVYLVTRDAGFEAFDALTGDSVLPVSREEAMEIGQSRVIKAVTGASYIDSLETGSEYRGGELPAWRLVLEDETHIYIGAMSGQIRAVRTSEWRLFDFLWSLHIMDYGEREDFNHPLIQGVAMLAVVAIFSGYLLYVLTRRAGRTGGKIVRQNQV